MSPKNTLNSGAVRYLVFKDDGVWYAAALEFNIVESGDTPQEALVLMFEAITGYVESARKIKARPNILNQKTDPEYERMWKALEEPEKKNSNIFSSGILNISQIFKGAMAPA